MRQERHCLRCPNFTNTGVCLSGGRCELSISISPANRELRRVEIPSKRVQTYTRLKSRSPSQLNVTYLTWLGGMLCGKISSTISFAAKSTRS